MGNFGLNTLVDQIKGKPRASGGSFLPDEYIRRRNDRRNAAISLALFVVVMGGVFGAFVVTNRQWETVRQEQAAVAAEFATEQEKIKQLQALEDQKQDMLERAVVATAVIERVPRSILLAEIINRLPDKSMLIDVGMTSKRINEKSAGKPGPAPQPKTTKASAGKNAAPAAPQRKEIARPPQIEFTLVIQGYAVSDAQVADFQSALRSTSLLSGVELVESRDQTVDEVTLKSFRIEAKVLPEADVRGLKPLKIARVDPNANQKAPSAGAPGKAGETRGPRAAAPAGSQQAGVPTP